MRHDVRRFVADLRRSAIGILPIAAFLFADGVRMTFYNLTLGCAQYAPKVPGWCPAPRIPGTLFARNAIFGIEALHLRVLWHGTVVILGIAAGLTMVLSLAALNRILNRSDVWRRSALWFLLAGITAFVAADSLRLSRTFLFVHELLALPSEAFTPGFARYIANVVAIIRAVTFIPLTPAVAALAALLVTAARSKDPVKLASVTRYARTLLFSAAALLVVAVLELHAFLHWITAGVHPDAHVSVEAAIQATVGAVGAIYATYLALLFAPVILMLASRTRWTIRRTAGGPGTPQAPLDDRATMAEWRSFITPILAILAPLLVGSPVAALLDLLK